MLSKDTLERTKLTLEILTFLSLLVIVGVIYCNGSAITKKIQTVLQSSGFRIEEVNFFSLFKLKVVDSLAIAETTAKELEEARILIACLHENKCTPQQVARNAEITKGLASLNRATEEQRRSIGEAIRQSEKVVQQTERSVIELPPPTPTTEVNWIALVGADRTLDAANDEVKRLKNASVPRVTVLLADGWFRTVVGYGSQAEAVAETQKLSGIVKRQPYVRNFKEWCVGATWSEASTVKCGSR